MIELKPVLKRLHSPDVLNIESYTPDDPTNFCLLLQIMFGPENSEGEESFDVVVCTPRWLTTEVEKRGFIDGRHHIILDKFDLDLLRSYFTEFAKECSGKTWQEVARKLSRLGKWEFEDYKP